MITFFPADVFKLALLMAIVCVAGIMLGWSLRRWLRPGQPFDWHTAGWMWVGFWAFGMLMSLIADLTTAAGQPFWLKTLMFLLLAVMAVGVALSERRFARRRQSIPAEPIHNAGGPGPTKV